MRPAALLITALLLAAAGPAAAGWLPIDTITNRPAEHDLTCENNGRAVACDRDGNIHVVWRGSVDGTAQLWYSRFDAAAGQWSEDTVPFSDPRGTMDPVLALDSGGNLLVARFLRATRMLKLVQRDSASGLWSEIDSSPGVSSESLLSLSVDRLGVTHFVWQYRPQSVYRIRYVQHDGSRWLNDTSFGQTDYSLTGPSVASSPEGHVMVVWRQTYPRQCILARTRRLGVWQNTDTVYDRVDCGAPSVAWGPDASCHIAWVGGPAATGQWVLHRESSASGWGETTRVASHFRSRVSPSVEVDPTGDVHVAWSGDDPASGQRQVYYRCRTRGGTWKADTVLSAGTSDKGRTSTSARSGRVHVAWTQTVESHPAVRLRRYERVHDVGVTRIVQPARVVDSGTAVEPVVRVMNLGTTIERDVVVRLIIDSTVQTRVLDELLPGQQTAVPFDTWVAVVPGWHAVSCSTSVAQDEWPDNNVLRDSFLVCVRDVAVDTILEPSGLMRRDTVRPRVVIRNNGNVHSQAKATLSILADSVLVYRDSVLVPLPPDSGATAVFRSWLGAPDCYLARCSVVCPGDMHPENDTASAAFELYWIDAGVESLVAPRDSVDSGVVVIPEALVRNHGSRGADFDVWMRIAGYSDSLRVAALAPGRDTLLRFRSWSAEPPGWNAIRCSVHTIDDMNAANDVRTGRTFVRVVDASADSIVEPDTVVRADSVRPRVLVRNRGNVPAGVEARFWIAGETRVYADSVRLELRAGQDTVVGFLPWRATVGRFSSCCSLLLAGDIHPENNALRRAFRVVRSDVGVASINWPTGRLDSGSVGQPRAMVTNLGSDPETFRARFRIGAFYDDTVEVPALAPGETLAVTFARCSLLARGRQAVSCSTLVEGDRNPENNCRRDSVFVVVRDGAVARILAPLEVISRGLIEPLAEVVNPGNAAGSAWVWFEISTGGHDAESSTPVYVDSQRVELEPGQTQTAGFRAWEAISGRYDERGWIVLAGDMRRENDTACASFVVARVDAEAQAIMSPCGVIQAGRVSPQVRVANMGDEATEVLVKVAVSRSDSAVVYVDSAFTPELGPICSTIVTLRQWNATAGSYLLAARVVLAGDENRANDTLSSVVVVESLASRRWAELASMPIGEWGRKPRAGARLASVGDKVMALKGGGSLEWYSYSPADSTWLRRESMPSGPAGRRVRGGSALCWDGVQWVYALKGNKTREFYCHDVGGDSWFQMASLPEHTPKPKYGAGLTYQSDRKGDKVYMVKGSGTLDFLVYEVATRQWHARRFLPAGPQDRKARHGTGFVASGSRMFCLKGGTCEFYEYIDAGDSWLVRRPLPTSGSGGRLTRCRRGAALAADASGAIYAFKGGRTSEFWRYGVGRDTWIQLDDIPSGNSRKRVHDGGALCCLGSQVYALKGGGSSEFWRYDATGLAGLGPSACGYARAGSPAAQEVPPARPDAASRSRAASDSRTSAPPVTSVVFDALGRRVRDVGRLEPGIYFCRTEQDRRTGKVVVLGRHRRSNTALTTER